MSSIYLLMVEDNHELFPSRAYASGLVASQVAEHKNDYDDMGRKFYVLQMDLIAEGDES